MAKEEHPWIKIKRYPHIGFPLNIYDIPKIEKYITNKDNVTKHSFLPFIHRTIFQRKYRPLEPNIKNLENNKRKREKKKLKAREIYFASHLDAQIYSYYSYLLSEKYNELLKSKSFNNSIVAYRKIEKETKGNKCNIDFALDTFTFIKQNENIELSVIVADVSKFFDSLDHKILKQKWSQVWGESITLPKDHYNVYKSLINMRYVNEDLLFRKYKNSIWIETKTENDPKTKKKRQKAIKHKVFLKQNNAIAYCEKDDFIKNSLNLISKTTNKKGIPQGTALSATLANIYMLDFDQEVQNYIDSVQGRYQRYSDDLIIVVPRKEEKLAIKKIRSLVANKVKLEIHPEKTKVYHFQNEKGTFTGYEVDEETNIKKPNSLEYLGFSYDGQVALIKTAGYSKFYRSMKRSFKRATSLAKYAKSTDDKIHKSALYRRFTYKGAGRRLIINKNIKTQKYDWGNYLSYVEKANSTFEIFNGGNQIKNQARKSWGKFHILMKNSIRQIEKHKASKHEL